MQRLLDQYAVALVPWADVTARRMLNDVNMADREAWRSNGDLISKALMREVYASPVGDRMHELLGEQVSLITSLPRKAAERVHDMTLEALATGGARYQEISENIARSGRVTESRATLIARTETSRTATVLVQARSENVGITHYHWRIVGDMDTRPGHRAMDGKTCEWAKPPLVMEGDPPNRPMHFHPGSVWNCRCWADPVIDVKALRKHQPF